MGEDEAQVSAPAPAVTVDRNPGSQIALALTVFALVLASNSIINESWLTDSTTLTNTDTSLTELKQESCNFVDCEIQTKSLEDLYNECIEENKEENSSVKEQECGGIADTHNAGYVATIMLISGSIALFAATIMQVRAMIGHSSRLANLVSGSSGLWIGISVLVWTIMLPETDSNPDWGQGLWLALMGATCGFIAGFSGTLQSWVDGPPRMRAQGVRSGTGMNEFVLKESSCGDHTLSILVDENLIRVVRIDRIGASPSVSDVLATRRDSYTGFSHQRLDWLDQFKGVWWVVAGASLISSFMISTLFLVPFLITAILAILQLMDPERFVISTNSGNHPFFINRWRSNRELTNLAMDLVDDAMIAVLRGEELDTTTLDARAEIIAKRFTLNREAKLSAAVKEQEVAATPSPPASVTESAAPTTQPENPAPESVAAEPEGTSVDAATTQNVQPQTEDTSGDRETQVAGIQDSTPAQENDTGEEQDAQSTEENKAVHETTNEQAPQAPLPPPSALPASLARSKKASPPSAAMPTPPGMPKPPGMPTPPGMPKPPGAPTMPPPPAPSAAPLPPPPMRQAMPPPPAMTGMPPPPGMGAMPPPPGMGGMPPPPVGAPIPPPIGAPQPITTPPPVLVQAAPREDNLSEDEMDDLLGDLSS